MKDGSKKLELWGNRNFEGYKTQKNVSVDLISNNKNIGWYGPDGWRWPFTELSYHYTLVEDSYLELFKILELQ